MISGPPAAGKGTQCERIVEKVNDLLQDLFDDFCCFMAPDFC